MASTLAASVSIPEQGEHGDGFRFEVQVEIKNVELGPKEELSTAVKFMGVSFLPPE